MSRIMSKGTSPERIVRSTLHALGYRFRLHSKSLPGTPDLVFPARSKVVFVNGCFWHGHNCPRGRRTSKSNIEFWVEKIQTNKRRDRLAVRRLRRAGWQVFTVWECKIRQDTFLKGLVDFLDRAN